MEYQLRSSILPRACLGDILHWLSILKKTEIDYPTTVFSEEEIVKYWNESNPDNPRISRLTNPRVNPYSNDGLFLTAWHRNKIVAYSGWQIHFGEGKEFFVLAGARVHPDYRRDGKMGEKSIASTLQNNKMEKLATKVGIGLLNNATLPEGTWQEAMQRRRWFVLPQNIEKYTQYIPEEVLLAHQRIAKEKNSTIIMYLPDGLETGN